MMFKLSQAKLVTIMSATSEVVGGRIYQLYRREGCVQNLSVPGRSVPDMVE